MGGYDMNDDKQQKELRLKMMDYRKFSFIFFFLGSFLYAGALLPLAGRTEMKTVLLYIGTAVLYGISLFFYWSIRSLREKLEEEL